jgi:hypothetical protein
MWDLKCQRAEKNMGSDGTINIHPDQVLNSYEPTRSDVTLVRVLIRCEFVRVVIEPKTCRIYETVL